MTDRSKTYVKKLLKTIICHLGSKTLTLTISALHLDSCSQKQEFDETYLGCGFPALGYNAEMIQAQPFRVGL